MFLFKHQILVIQSSGQLIENGFWKYMSIDLKQFAALQKASKDSFFEQKKLIKQVMGGTTVLCKNCKQPINLYTPDLEEQTGVRCAKGCTDIALDFV